MRASTLELRTADGPMPVFQARPDGKVTGGVIVVQDVFGVTPYLEGVTRDLAELGWLALAPHLYHRDGAPVVQFDRFPEGENHLLALTGTGILADLDACLGHLSAEGVPASSSAVIGFCMGGTVAHLAATERPLGAAVTFYGQLGASPWRGVTPALERAGRLQAPWLGLFGEDDPLVPIDEVRRLLELIEQAGPPHMVITYPGAGHAFHRSSTPDTYHPEAAESAWKACTAWLAEHLDPTQP